MSEEARAVRLLAWCILLGLMFHGCTTAYAQDPTGDSRIEVEANQVWWDGELASAKSVQGSFTHHAKKGNWIFRTRIPYEGDQPIWRKFDSSGWNDLRYFRIRQYEQLDPGEFYYGHDNLGDISVSAVYKRIGLSLVIPSDQDGSSARSQWLLGPQVIGKHFRLTHHLDVSGDTDIQTNLTTLELFFGQDFGKWRIESLPVIRYDWEAVSKNELELPINFGVSREFGKSRVGINVDYFVATPERFGPEWRLNLRVIR